MKTNYGIFAEPGLAKLFPFRVLSNYNYDSFNLSVNKTGLADCSCVEMIISREHKLPIIHWIN